MPGNAIRIAPRNPTASPARTAGEGKRRARMLATAAANNAVAPFSMPVSADDTCCSANGNMLSGKASHKTPSQAVPQRSDARIGRRAAGTSESVRNPIAMRVNVTPFGATASRPSAMNRNDAPQMQPGRISSSQLTTLEDVPFSDPEQMNISQDDHEMRTETSFDGGPTPQPFRAR